MSRPLLLDLFCGEGGAGYGYHLAGFDVEGVDNAPARLKHYPFSARRQGDALEFIATFGHEFDAIHASPPCQGYSRGTVALPDRAERYDRLIDATREALKATGRPYVIENVMGARSELHDPVMLCGRMFGLEATDEDGTRVVLDRHRLFETSFPMWQPEHPRHDRSVQVAGSYGGARRDKDEARLVRRGGYVPHVDVQRELLGTPWMTERGCQLSIPPAYTRHIGAALLGHLRAAA
jgi:DNA (cytosine-5)-methyltransferase 1